MLHIVSTVWGRDLISPSFHDPYNLTQMKICTDTNRRKSVLHQPVAETPKRAQAVAAVNTWGQPVIQSKGLFRTNEVLNQDTIDR